MDPNSDTGTNIIGSMINSDNVVFRWREIEMDYIINSDKPWIPCTCKADTPKAKLYSNIQHTEWQTEPDPAAAPATVLDNWEAAVTALVTTTGRNSRVGSGSGSTWNRTVATGLDTLKTRPSGNGPVLPTKTRQIDITTLSPMKYLSSDCIMTWSVCRLCSSSRSFASRSQICDPTNICLVAIENLLVLLTICPFFTATHRISVRSQIGKQEVKEQPDQHNLHTDHVTIQWQLKYLIGGQGFGNIKL